MPWHLLLSLFVYVTIICFCLRDLQDFISHSVQYLKTNVTVSYEVLPKPGPELLRRCTVPHFCSSHWSDQNCELWI